MADHTDNRALTAMGPLVPEPVHGSPASMRQHPDDALLPEHMLPLDQDLPWWRPGVWDIAKVVGWRWIMLGPALVVGALVPLEMFLEVRLVPIIAAGIKLVAFAWGVVISIVAWAIRNAVRARKEAFCIHCGYVLEGLGERGSCPECGRPFHVAMINEFRKDPHFFVTRHKALRDARRSVVFPAGAGPTASDGTR